MTLRNEGSEARPAGAQAGAVEGPGVQAPTVESIEAKGNEIHININMSNKNQLILEKIIIKNEHGDLYYLDEIVDKAVKSSITVVKEAFGALKEALRKIEKTSWKYDTVITVDPTALAASIAATIPGAYAESNNIIVQDAISVSNGIGQIHYPIDIVLKTTKSITVG